MNQRKSISIPSLSHLTAIPVATRIGPLVVSSVIAPFNPGTRVVPDTVSAQYANIFHHVGLMLAEAGADWRHVAKMEFWTPPVERGWRNAIVLPCAPRRGCSSIRRTPRSRRRSSSAATSATR